MTHKLRAHHDLGLLSWTKLRFPLQKSACTGLAALSTLLVVVDPCKVLESQAQFLSVTSREPALQPRLMHAV